MLSSIFFVSGRGRAGIPTLVILNEKGEVITKNGRGAVSLDPDGKVHIHVHPLSIIPPLLT